MCIRCILPKNSNLRLIWYYFLYETVKVFQSYPLSFFSVARKISMIFLAVLSNINLKSTWMKEVQYQTSSMMPLSFARDWITSRYFIKRHLSLGKNLRLHDRMHQKRINEIPLNYIYIELYILAYSGWFYVYICLFNLCFSTAKQIKASTINLIEKRGQKSLIMQP